MGISEKLERGMDLTFEETTSIFEAMFDRQLREEEMEKTLIRLADKGETGDEIAAAAHVLRNRAIAVNGHCGRLLDVVGTGGDSSVEDHR